MCGRFALYSDPFTLARRFEADALPELRPRYNVAPSQNIPIVREEERHKTFCAGPLGPDPALGEGYEDRLQHDQRPGRDGGRKTGVPQCFQAPALPDSGRRLLRMASYTGFKGQATLVYCAAGP